MKKRIVSLFLILALCLSLLPAAFADELELVDGSEEPADVPLLVLDGEDEPEPEALPPADETEGSEIASGSCGEGVTWSLDSGGNLSILGSGAMDDYQYEGSSGNKPGWWGKYSSQIQTVTVAKTVTHIGAYAFEGCYNLQTATISFNTASFGEGAFYECEALTKVRFYDDEGYAVGSVGDEAAANGTAPPAYSLDKFTLGKYCFFGCKRLEDLNLSHGILVVDDQAFYGCEALTSFSLPGLLRLGWDAFYGCTSLTWISLDAQTIGGYAFCGCTALERVYLHEGTETIGVSAFQDCTALETLELPESLTTIESSAFSGCVSLEELRLRIRLEKLGAYAFSGCTGLTRIDFLCFPPEFGSQCFRGVTADAYYYDIEGWESELCKNYGGDLNWLYNPRVGSSVYWSLDREGTLELWGIGATYDYEGYGNNSPFSYCSSAIDRIEIGGSVTAIGVYVFASMSNFTELSLPDGLRYIGDGAFMDCHSLLSVTIPDSVTEIDLNAFRRCSALEELHLGSGLETIGTYAFMTCESLTEVTIPDSVTRLYDYAFHGCENLASVKLGSGLQYISYRSLAELPKLKEITIPESVIYLGNNVFEDDAGLKTVTFLGAAPTFGEGGIDCFKNVTATVYFPSDKAGWTPAVRQNYGGKLTWVPYTPKPYPVLTEAFNSATGVRVSWLAFSGAAKYELLRKNLTTGEKEWHKVGETTACTLIDTTAKSSNRYTYTVRPVDKSGMTGQYDETGRTCTYIAMSSITELKVTSSGVSLTWSKPAGAKNFRVMRKIDGEKKWTVLAVIQGTSYVDKTAKTGTKYWYT
nr:leucine-rich repeat protein [Oscillospiraceae bacterium]